MAGREETYLGVLQIVARGATEGERKSAYARAVEFQQKYRDIHTRARKVAARNKVDFPDLLSMFEAEAASGEAASRYASRSPKLREQRESFVYDVKTEVLAHLLENNLYLVSRPQLESIVAPILAQVGRAGKFKLREQGVADYEEAAKRGRRPSERASATPYGQEGGQEAYLDEMAQAEGRSKNLAALSAEALDSMPAPYKDIMVLFLQRREEIEAEEAERIKMGKKVKKKPLLQFTARELSEQTGVSKPECEKLIIESFVLFQAKLASLLDRAEKAARSGARWRRL